MADPTPSSASWLSWLADLRFAARMLAKNRGFALAALLTLALCIGANTAISSIVDRLILRSRSASRIASSKFTIAFPKPASIRCRAMLCSTWISRLT